MKNKYELIIFDLDGTLLDTSPGIFNSVRYAEQQMGFSSIPDSRLKEFVGPPPKSMYMKVYGIDEDTALQAAKKHREYGRTKAIYEAKVYPEIIDLLENLKSNGYKLAVSTLKSQEIAESILANFKIDKYFDAIVGMDLEETFTKCKTIQMAMAQTGISSHALMIGDSQYDYDGAVEAGVDFWGVTYGFGYSRDKDYPFTKIDTPNELVERL